MKDILAVILCGGESKRMGADKGLLPLHNTIRAKFMADKLSFLKVPVVFSINKGQYENYKDHIPADILIIDDNKLEGPARGLISVHNRFPDVDILLLACDMLELDSSTINRLFEVYTREKNYDYYVHQDEKYAQPFCGIYTVKGLDTLREDINVRSLTNISMQYILNSGHTKRIPIEDKKAFKNYNLPG